MTAKELAEKLNEVVKQGKGDYNIILNGGEYCDVIYVEVNDEYEDVNIE